MPSVEASLPRWPAESAFQIASEAARIWALTKRGVASKKCRLCNHPERIEMDAQLLQGNPFQRVLDMLPADVGYRSDQVRVHLENHLLPIVRGEVKIPPTSILAVPFPEDTEWDDQERWFGMIYQALRDLALEGGGKDGPNVIAALRAVDRHYEIAKARAARKQPKSANPSPEGLREALPAPEPIKRTPEMIRALERSRGVGYVEAEDDAET